LRASPPYPEATIVNLAAAQSLMADLRIDAWLVFDFRGSNPVLGLLLPGTRVTTRRTALLIPATGKPRLLVQALDEHQFDGLAGIERDVFVSWRQLHEWLAAKLATARRVAMEYSPGNALPVVGIVDAGTIELVRAAGVEVVSSADLIQASVATWSATGVSNHAIASEKVARIKDDAFQFIRERLRTGQRVLEHEAADIVRGRFKQESLEWPDGPIVAVNEHSADPHYEPGADHPREIRRGDWILLDLWARVPGNENIYSDITWTAYAGETVPAEHRRVFEAVRAARDASLRRAQEGWKLGGVEGWQLDDAARDTLVSSGLGSHVKHRTGHSLSPGARVHGVGMNLDNLETHDTRRMLAGTGFTIEPGAYLDGRFGVRNEIDVYVDPARGPIVTSCKQDDIVLV
jgi:Xaa-Pro dipeptidase